MSMDVTVLSKAEFIDQLKKAGVTDDTVHQYPNTMFISILNTHGVGDNEPYFYRNHPNVLVLSFDDVIEDIIGVNRTIHAFTEYQGRELLSFINANLDKKQCIVHCSAGISRSGAVGTFINDYTGGDFAEFKKKNPYTKPNPLVLRIMNNLVNGYASD